MSNTYHKVISESTNLKDLAAKHKVISPVPIVAALVNGELKDLEYTAEKGSAVELIDTHSEVGSKIYLRSLVFLFIKACKDVFPDAKVYIKHSLGDGMYCEVVKGKPLEEEDVEVIECQMTALAEQDIPIIKTAMPYKEALSMFSETGLEDKARVMKYRDRPYINVYAIEDLKDYFYGFMVPSTGVLKWFKLKYYLPGLILQVPNRANPTQILPYREQPKLSGIFRESDRWAKILNVTDVGGLNDLIASGRASDIIRVNEALHEKKIAQIADNISRDHENIRVILISGPSSSGKTTFAHRLTVQLMVNGLKPVSISLDDYFLDRDKTPIDEDGNPDFEALEAIDLKLFNSHLTKLIQGQEAYIPIFNFITGKRERRKESIKVDSEHPLIIEGIHGLNNVLTSSVPKEKKYKIYVSALTQLRLDDHNRISTTGSRLLRRIVRDSWSRQSDAKRTIAMWPSVLRGAERNIFPFQEEADIMFNSALVYELSVLKKYAEPLLQRIEPGEPEYLTSKYLLKFLSYFVSLEDEQDIPRTSIIREFIGGCGFYD